MEDKLKPPIGLAEKASTAAQEIPSEIPNMRRTQQLFFRMFCWISAILAALLIIGILLKKPLSKMLSPKKEIKAQPGVEQVDNVQLNNRIIDPDNPPKFIQADFVELDKVYSISKFRSGMGHDYSHLSLNGETCRSMKHYFSTMDPSQPVYKYEGYSNENTPTPSVEKDVKIFSPVDGVLSGSDSEIAVTPDAYPDIAIRFQHVAPLPGITNGHVKAGQPIGLVLANQSFDLAIEFTDVNDGEKKMGYISYFAAMPDTIFAKYQERGVGSRDDLIISRAYRDANALSCHGKEIFDKDYPALDGRAAHIVDLSGFKETEAEIQAKYPNPNIVKTRDTNPSRK